MDIGIFVGSIRKDSYNRKIGEFIKENYGDQANFEIFRIDNLPLFSEDLEDDVPQVVLDLRAKVKSKDGFIIITPEYNHSIPGVMKNALDWMSRGDYPMMKKPYLLMGASTGSTGTIRAQAHMRQILNSGAYSMYSYPNNEFIFADVQDKMDEDGNIINEGSLRRLKRRVEGFIDFINQLNK